MNIGLIDVDGHNFPNFALMKISAWHKAHGDNVEWCGDLYWDFDRVYKSKIFTFSPDIDRPFPCEVICGGTGYDVKSRLPQEIEQSTLMDYSLYPQYDFSIQFFSRGCIRHCPFCLVREKEGVIHPVHPVQPNPNEKWIEVLDNNFFANPEWKSAIDYLLHRNKPVNLHGVDVRIMNEEQAYHLNKLRLRKSIHIAWDLPELDLSDKLMEVTRYIKPYKLMCYILVGFNSTMEQDLYRIERCRELGIKPYVMPYRDYENKTKPSQYAKDLAQYVNKPMIFRSCKFEDFSPRKGFTCKNYFTHENK
ncbi:radical SAM protein [Muribaculum intestinale]|uniref:Radical SAM protein n=1 Tax=Muribaculum intestinale TaxID=1796646 RepID=A0A4S2FXC3_9BACT|nr:hypothetical protein [Muribaculum intestinale]MYM12893.1 hypothetical protein [Muribaculum intestinale]TGY74105.1 hypothetical protein E5333_07465 [Muribaculum intestinale]